MRLCGVMCLIQFNTWQQKSDICQKRRLTFQDLMTAVMCLSTAMADSSQDLLTAVKSSGWQFLRLGDSSQMNVNIDGWHFKTWWQQLCLSTAMANSSRLGDSSMMFHKSNCRQLLTELLQNDDGLHATLVLKPAHSRTSVETSRST